jgi:alkylhydroperoxidase family enzyme
LSFLKILWEVGIMARIRGAEPAQLGWLTGLFTGIVYAFTRRALGRVVMPVQVVAHHARILWGYGQMEQSLLGSHRVEAGLKDLASLRVATLVGCPFWIDIGSAVSRQNGLSQKKIEALPQYRESGLFSETEKQVLEYSDAMTHTPVEVPEKLFAELRQKLNEAQLVELTATIAWENYRARFDHAFGIEAEGFTEGSYCAQPVRERPETLRDTWHLRPKAWDLPPAPLLAAAGC